MSTDLEKLQAHVSLLQNKLSELSQTFRCGCETLDCADCERDNQIAKALALSSHCASIELQANAIESLVFPVMLRKMWSGQEVQNWINERADIIRSQCKNKEKQSA
jgi:hypothetical protein